MNIKTAFLSSAAAAFLIASPALAQDGSAAAPATQDPAAAAAPAAQQSLQLTPGSTVRGPDGDLGQLVGVQANASGEQELTVRGADGQVRAVPLNGIRQDGANVVVDYTKAEYDAASPIAGGSETASPAPGDASEPTTQPMDAPAAGDSMTPPSSDPSTTSTPPLPTEPTSDDPADAATTDDAAPAAGDQPQA